MTTSIAGHENLGIKNAQINVVGTDFSVFTDDQGTFEIRDIPLGSYSLTIDSPHFFPMLRDFTVLEQETIEMDDLPSMEFIYGDANGDGKIGLEDAIRALQVVSGQAVGY